MAKGAGTPWLWRQRRTHPVALLGGPAAPTLGPDDATEPAELALQNEPPALEARCLAVLVASPALSVPACRSVPAHALRGESE